MIAIQNITIKRKIANSPIQTFAKMFAIFNFYRQRRWAGTLKINNLSEAFLKSKTSLGSVFIEILSFRQKSLLVI